LGLHHFLKQPIIPQPQRVAGTVGFGVRDRIAVAASIITG
jgi:hypothetical protein